MGLSEGVPGAEARFVGGLDVRAKARTYLRSNGKSKGNGRSRFPAGMTERRQGQRQVPIQGSLRCAERWSRSASVEMTAFGWDREG